MNGTRASVRAYAFGINAAMAGTTLDTRVVFCPPAPFLTTASEALPQNAQLKIGAQNCHAAKSGAFTGEVSATQLYECGARYVILGHSERRGGSFETCADIRAKAEAAIAAGLIAILCVGESREEYETGQTAAVLQKQAEAFKGLGTGSFVVAYEPVWAIGSGNTPTAAEISAAHRVIKTALGSETSVLYGGSVNAENIREILSLPDVQGALIGGASLEIHSMRQLIVASAKGF